MNNSSLPTVDTSIKVCPYCKGLSPTCIECDFGGYTGENQYKRVTRPTGFISNTPSPSVARHRDFEVELKLANDTRKVDQIISSGLVDRKFSVLLQLRTFWRRNIDKVGSKSLKQQIRNLLSKLELFIQRYQVKTTKVFHGGKKKKKGHKINIQTRSY